MDVSKEFKQQALRQKQSLPLEAKIVLTQERIREWYEHYDGNVYVLFSGGKDSTVLKHLVETTDGVWNVPSVFVNTGLEYPEIQRFVMGLKDAGDNIEILRPEIGFNEVLKLYGYPVISKEVAKAIQYARQGSNWAICNFQGTNKDGSLNQFRKNMYGRHAHLLAAPFRISHMCCNVMKEKPLTNYGRLTGRKPIIGTLASESMRRRNAYLKTGCNAFESNTPMSKPMSFWTEQDVLEYIVTRKLAFASVYGEILQDENGKYYTTGADRTGCMFCAFGAQCKNDIRFKRLKETHPKQYSYCINGGEFDETGMWIPNKDGLGMSKVLDYIGVDYK